MNEYRFIRRTDTISNNLKQTLEVHMNIYLSIRDKESIKSQLAMCAWNVNIAGHKMPSKLSAVIS